MKKLYLFIFLIAGFITTASAQYEGLQQFTRSYFRSDPLLGQFSAFLAHLNKDPAITNKKINLKTDTSLYQFQGLYEKYNPFSFKTGKIEIWLSETPVQYTDSLPPNDTVLIYQLIAYADSSYTGSRQKEVKKEFDKIHRKYARRFFDSNYNELKENGVLVGEYHNYFVPMHGMAPLTVAWGLLGKEKRAGMVITFRMKTSDNMAVLPEPLYYP